MFVRVIILLLALVSSGFAKERIAFIYYYAWYANPAYDGQWLHWQDYGHHPPEDISSAFFPKLAAYSSNDPWVIHQHMKWIAEAQINVIIYSWWGQKDPTNITAAAVLDAAADYNLAVAFMIEPYEGRTTRSICEDIDYLQRRFGRHPAFFKLARETTFHPQHRPAPMFFIYQPDYSTVELRMLADQVHGNPAKPLIVFQSTDAAFMARTHSDGIFAYEAVQPIRYFYADIMREVRARNGFFIPCVSPGFNINKTMGVRSSLFRSRRSGKNYDGWWEKVVAADSEFVAILSFNEWHEGTQIEPAANEQTSQSRYLSYQGAFGKMKNAAPYSYLLRTAHWINILERLP